MDQRIKWLLTGGLCLVAVVMLLRGMFAGPDVDALAVSESAEDRLDAAVLLGERSGRTEVLVRLANDADRTVAMQAVHAMGRRRDTTSRRALDVLLTDGRDPQVRGAAAAALGHFPQTDPSQLAAVLDANDDPEVRAGAARGLARLGHERPEEALPLLVKGLRDRDPRVRVWSITGIYNVSSHQFPGYDAARPPEAQREVIAFIESKLRSEGLLK